MKRICEELLHSCVLAPAEVASGTLTTTSFVDASNVPEVEFLLTTGALANGKKVTVSVYTSDVAAGTGAELVEDTVFTAGSALTSAVVAVSYQVKATGKRYVGLKFKHDAGAGVVCGVTASARVRDLPADNAWAVMA